MKLMCPATRLSLGFFASILIIFGIATGISAQRRSSSSKKPVAKKTESRAKDARKGSKATAKAKDTRRDSKKGKETARSTSRDKRDNKKDTRSKAETRRAETERRRAEAARRAAALAEQRRREEAARIARERRLAFERGLRTETVANITKDNTDGEDLRVRQAAVDALGSRAGTIVVMEAQTGRVVTIVNQDWAIRNGFKPCSTIKLVTGVAGLNENAIDSEGNVSNLRMKLDDAVAFSNNAYFQRVGSNLGSAKMTSYARTLGLGEPTGINAEGEYAGRVPNGNNNPRIYSHGDDFEVTPLQLAVLVSEISSNGKKVVPQIAKSRYENTNFHEKFRPAVNLPGRDFEGMLPGMIGAAQYGTAHRGVNAGLGIAGKTGSCIGKGSWVGLFASVAPVENPKYAVVVITRGQGERGKYAAAVAGKIYDALSPQLKRDPARYQALLNLRPRTDIDSRTAAASISDEDEDEDTSADGDSNDKSGSTWVPPSKRSGDVIVVSKPLIKRTVDSKPVNPASNKAVEIKPAFPAPAPAGNKPGQGKTFPPVVITYKKDKVDDGTAPAVQRPRIVVNN